MKNKRIILDTNLWISFLISNDFAQIDSLVQEKDITFLFSDESLKEFIEVVERPKFQKFFSSKDVEKLLDTFDQYAALVTITSEIDICRDPKDNFLLNLAVDGKADFLVTGDKDLLVIGMVKTTEILTFRNLVEKLNLQS